MTSAVGLNSHSHLYDQQTSETTLNCLATRAD